MEVARPHAGIGVRRTVHRTASFNQFAPSKSTLLLVPSGRGARIRGAVPERAGSRVEVSRR